MFNRSSFLRSSLVLTLALSAAACDGPRSGAEIIHTTPGALTSAHEAYLTGDFVALGERVHDVLLDPAAGALAQENALELLDKAYEAANGKLPSRFQLPPEWTSMKVAASHGKHPNGEWRGLMLHMRVKEGVFARMTDITVRRAPDEILVDRASGRGKLAVRPSAPGFEDVVLEATNLDALPADGVLAIRIALDGRTAIDTWVPARRLASTEVPEIASPAPSAMVAEGRPTIRFTPFHSPEASPFETPTLSVYVEDVATKKTAFDQWLGTPGDLGAVQVDHALVPGPYWLAVTAGEDRMFGPITVARHSQSALPFRVAR